MAVPFSASEVALPHRNLASRPNVTGQKVFYMPMFFFNIARGDVVVRDYEGSELADLEAAREEAIASARETMSDAIRQGKDVSSRAFEIFDEEGKFLLKVP
ncbi:hypothetical protein FHS85_005364, partial [Rhodoligotrophos appendicifer]